ncbi:MAG: hypothetical protein M3Y74_17310 [Chloroflexota bacterium]|nr:hypothetical protein [Chloroflexota bacterium]
MDPKVPVAEPDPIVALPPAVAPIDVDDTGGVSGVSDDAGALTGVELLPLFAPIECITWSNEVDDGALKGISTPELVDAAGAACAWAAVAAIVL